MLAQMPLRTSVSALALLVLGGIAFAQAADIRIACYSDGNECPATKTLAERFMKDNPDIHIQIDEMPYKSILESVPVQLAAGNGPDIARVSDFSQVVPYQLDLTPYLKDAAYWEKAYGPVLDWMRAGPEDKGIYGLMTQLTVSAPIVNKTLFDQAGVPVPAKGATWDDWAAAALKVAKATKTPFGMAWDRSGARFAGPAISEGAKYFYAAGHPPVVDDGYKTMAAKWVKWNQDGTVDKDVWVATGGGYRDAFEEFANGKIAVYLSGSWQLARLQKQIGDGFEWVVGSAPCGPAACTGMPGGAGFVAFKGTKSPKEVAKFLDYLAQPAVYGEWMVMTSNLPANVELQKQKLDYKLSPAGSAAMSMFQENATTLTPLAYKLQGSQLSRPMFNATVDRISQAIAGQITLDQAYDRITADVADAAAAKAKK
ncbi:sugar ABC transporter substrate-binding protein [Aliidongia dinghuensis]|uniref:Sugar ABC transporter substrate-binding protein n=1 Tax=Aliidongia dinghuensis TaxID=1867774 RepID=A0A8J3E540_9PROT|nr:ABC transporter substrate-binding protein [Aliidongia dinghuensis]GGF32400.1 sugar ABC transporter substrate-binding protein [Aliidongia dinghuensis]